MIGYNLPSVIIFSFSFVLQNIDVDILKEINLNRNTQFDAFFQIFTNSVSLIAWLVPLFLLIIGFTKRQIQIRKKALFLLSSVVLSSVLTLILKYAINRPRPFDTYTFLEKITSGGSPSFPSGHTSEAFAIAIALCFAYPRWFVIIPSIIWAITIGYSRMSLGVHYPSDVLVGAIIGIASAYACYKGQHFLRRSDSQQINPGT